ncbi:MAG: hypothetical protein Q4C46_08110 [Bacillota bacterium]|nr:hypothetical protein [Bacillota bacterium]
MKKACTLCGCSYGDIYAFKNGRVCENCLQYLKTDIDANGHVRSEN